MRDRPTGLFDIVGNRGWFYLFSFLILLPGIISLIIPPRLKLGIDFSSGSTFTVRFEQPVSKDDLRSAMADLHHPEARVQGTGQNEFLVRTKELRGAAAAPPVGPAPSSERDAIEGALRERFGNLADAQGVGSPQQGFIDFSSISATVSGKLSLQRSPPFICCGISGNAVSAVAAASLAIFAYLWWSFRQVPQAFRFGNLADAQGVGSPQQGFIDFSSISATVSGKLGVQKSPPFICCGISGNAVSAVAAASLAIFAYLWWSFRQVPQAFRFGAAAVLALLHDAILVVGAFSILGKVIDTEINVMFITALLTVIGFSVHDSIVVFDRIRETVTRGEGRSFADAVNSSLLQTLGRSLNTSLMLVFSVLALMLIGGSSISEFLWAMLIGTVTGAYSSIFIASQILVSWDEGDVPRLFRRIFGRAEPEQFEAAAAEA